MKFFTHDSSGRLWTIRIRWLRGIYVTLLCAIGYSLFGWLAVLLICLGVADLEFADRS